MSWDPEDPETWPEHNPNPVTARCRDCHQDIHGVTLEDGPCWGGW